VAPAFPLDAKINSVTVNGRETKFEVQRTGEVQRIEVTATAEAAITEILFTYDEGTDVYVEREAPRPGASNQGLRVVRSRAEAGDLHMTLEGFGGRTYEVRARTPYRVGEANGVRVIEATGHDTRLLVSFEGPADTYVHRELVIPLLRK